MSVVIVVMMIKATDRRIGMIANQIMEAAAALVMRKPPAA